MGRLDGAHAHQDERGTIVDLLVGTTVDAVTYLTFASGAVRGNHFHKETTQWTLVVEGCVTYAESKTGQKVETFIGRPGDLFVSEPHVIHAVKAEMNSSIVVFTSGPRAGASYENDTFRVPSPIL